MLTLALYLYRTNHLEEMIDCLVLYVACPLSELA